MQSDSFQFRTLMQIVILHSIYYGFWYGPEISKEISPKTHFWGFFTRFLGHTLPHPKDSAQISCQMKGVMKIHNPGKFHIHGICGCQLIYLQSFSYQQKGGFLVCFWVLFGTLWPQIKSDLHKTFTSGAVQRKVSHKLRVLIYYWKF